MDDVLIGLLLFIAGAGLLLAGLRVFFILLPVWGFIAGFFLGATLVHGWFGEGFLTTVAGWIVGLGLGIVFALISFVFWYAGAILAAASIGALIATGLMAILDVDSGGWVLLAAAIGAALGAFVAIVLNLPVYIVIVSTAFSGATAIVTSLLLFLDRLDLDDLRYGGAWAFIDNSLFWLLAWALLAGVGIAVQASQMAMVPLPAERWIRAGAVAREQRAAASDRDARA